MKLATYLGSLVQLGCGERWTLQTNTAVICGERSQWMDRTEFATTQASVCFPGLHCSGSRLLCKDTVPGGLCMSCTSQVQAAQVLGCSAGHRPRWTVRFVPILGPSSSVNRVLGECTVPGGLCILSPPWSRLLGFPGVPREHRPRCVMCLFWGAVLRR